VAVLATIGVGVGVPASAAPGQDVAHVEAPFQLIVPGGRLYPGVTNRIFVAAVTADGDLPSRPPRVTASEGAVEFDEAIGPGVFAYRCDVPIQSRAVEFSIGVFGGRYVERLETFRAPESALRVPERVEGVARTGEVVFVVQGEDLPPAEALQLSTSEGRVAGVSRVEDGIEVRILPDESRYPRHLTVGLRDPTRIEKPAWVSVRLRARLKLDYVTEPGASAEFRVGERTYGPFEADSDGRISAWIDQYPGESVAQAIFSDDLGNETVKNIPLATKSEATIVALPTGELVVGQHPPEVYLRASSGDGGAWNRTPPTCRTPAFDLQTLALERGTWVVPLPEVEADDPQDLRIECNIGINASTALRVPVAQGIPQTIRLRVWPTELRADFPEAEIHVMVEDALGERVDVTGLRVEAVRGEVTMEETAGLSARGEYAGGDAVDAGLDSVRVTYDAPPSDSYVSSVMLGWDDIPMAGRVTLHARALDAHARPVEGVEVELDAGAASETGISGPDGWVSVDVVVPMRRGPVRLAAAARDHRDSVLVLKGQEASELQPGAPDLRADQVIKLSPGRVAGISVSVDPVNLRAGPGAVAYVRVRLEDRAGKAVVDEPVVLVASSGTVGPLRPKADGTFIAEYQPEAGETSAQVMLTAETESLHSTTTLNVQPRLVRLSLAAYGGGLSNFAAVSAPLVGLDADFRVRHKLLGERLMMRVGGARYAFERSYRLDGERWTVSSAVYPVHLSLLYRADRGPAAGWFGGGAAVAFLDMQAQTGGSVVLDGLLLTGGPVVITGVGHRFLGGEVFLTVRAHWLRGVGSDVGFSGNIGGLAAGAGYRILF